MSKNEKSAEGKHEFWETQPVVAPEEVKVLKKKVPEGFTPGPIETKTVDQISKEPLPVASILEWCQPDVNNDKDLQELYTLLHEHYVEDAESTFRFNYSPEFLKWALTPPNYFKEWHIGVRKKETKELLAFISGVPAHIRMGETTKLLCEINFLCVSKRLRDKKLAPILIKEVTRRVNLRDIWQAVYTAGIEIPTPISTTQYWHRSLNPEKLIDIGFSRMPPQFERLEKPMDGLKRSLQLESGRVSGLRPMEEADLPAVAELLKKQLSTTAVAPAFDQEELKHWLLTPKKHNIVFAYVRENKEKVITDFVSFYQLCSSVLEHPRHKDLKAAYAYYYAAMTVDAVKLFNEALHLAKDLGFDVFNALNIMDNDKFIKPLKFGAGDGKLRYYLFNWKMLPCEAKEVGIVML